MRLKVTLRAELSRQFYIIIITEYTFGLSRSVKVVITKPITTDIVMKLNIEFKGAESTLPS